MQTDNEIIQLTKLFHQTIKKFGLKKVIRHLSSLRNEENTNGHEQIVSVTIKLVCGRYGITEQDIKRPYVKGDASVARMLVIVLLKKHTNLSHKEVSEFLARTNKDSGHVIVSQALREFKDLDEKIKPHKTAKEVFSEIDTHLTNYKLMKPC